MKVELVTFIRAYNYGAVLQCYALQTAIQETGVICEVLDYYPSYFRDLYSIRKDFRWTHPPVKTWINHFMLRNTIKMRNKAFNDFINKFICLSAETYTGKSDVQTFQSDADCYIVGSDQVWNYACTYFDPLFFLDFPDANKCKKYSYAACVGIEKIPEDLVSGYKEKLENYEAYSVREEASVALLNDLLQKEIRVDCDPTFLLKQEQWEKMCNPYIEKDDYIFIYYVEKTKKLQQYAEILAKEKHMKIICVPCNVAPEVLSGKNDAEFDLELQLSASPQDILTYIKNAAYVVTNSFHGTALSIIFHKKFISKVDRESGKINIRIDDLLEKFDLCSRKMGNCEIDAPIVWENVDVTLDALRYKGKEYLSWIMNNANEK